MEIKIECPWCNQEYSVDESLNGQKVECSVCEKEFIVKSDTLITQKEESPGSNTEPTSKKDEREATKELIIFFIAFAVFALCVWGISSYNESQEHKKQKQELKQEIARKNGSIEKAKDMCNKAILMRLKSPSTATITYEKENKRDNNMFVFSGYVDAHNSFGGMMRNRFIVEISFDPNDPFGFMEEERKYHLEKLDFIPW